MEQRAVVSSNISDAGFDGQALFLRFHSGEVYRYDGVPRGVFDAMERADSAGRFFHKFVKGKYRYTRLDIDPFQAQAVSPTPRAGGG